MKTTKVKYQGNLMRNVQRDNYFNLVLFTSQLYFIGQLYFRSSYLGLLVFLFKVKVIFIIQ
jgi:hypothetical protein